MEHIRATAEELRKELTSQFESAQVEVILSTDPNNPKACVCRGDGWVRVTENGKTGLRRCICAQKRLLEARLNGIPKRFRQATLDNYAPIDDLERAAVMQIRNG